jgi:Flp pilus assembly pilin Flp
MKLMNRISRQLWSDESGQDLIEYTLLLAFLALVAAGVFISSGTAVKSIWGSSSTMLTSASTSAS